MSTCTLDRRQSTAGQAPESYRATTIFGNGAMGNTTLPAAEVANPQPEKRVIANQTFDEERALYNVHDALIENCVFDGPADGESVLKETANIDLVNCDLRLRYPLWHVTRATMDGCTMPDTCRAALWYDEDMTIKNSTLGGIKALRECDNSRIENCTIDSPEFGWRCRTVDVKDSTLNSMYPFFESCDGTIDNLTMTAKYSFQYTNNFVIRNSHFTTKDAFWHSKNVTVYDSVLDGEYLAWYSENLHLVRCHIKGTQPFCYAKGLVLEDCTMEDCDLAFERSDVQATIHSHVDSIKNPVGGRIEVDSVGELILEDGIADMEHTQIIVKDESN